MGCSRNPRPGNGPEVDLTAVRTTPRSDVARKQHIVEQFAQIIARVVRLYFPVDKVAKSHNMARMPHHKTSSPYRVQVLDRALEILRVVGDRQGDSSLVEICKALKLHKSTVHRLIMVLERHRMVDKNPDTGRYHLGLRLFELGSKAISVLDLRDHSRPFLNQVLNETQETVHFCILDQGEILYIEKLEPERSVRLASRVGRRSP